MAPMVPCVWKSGSGLSHIACPWFVYIALVGLVVACWCVPRVLYCIYIARGFIGSGYGSGQFPSTVRVPSAPYGLLAVFVLLN